MAGVDLRHQGTVLLNTRINFYDGRRPGDDDYDIDDYWRGRHSKWTVVRHTPKDVTWAASTHALGWRAHRIKYQLVATHVGGMRIQITVWMCGARCKSPIEVVTELEHRQCWTCLGRSEHAPV